MQNRPGDANALALATAEGLAAFADLRVVAIWFLDDEIMGVRGLCRRHHIFAAGIRPRENNIFVNRPTEQKWFLKDNAYLRAQIVLSDLLDVHSVDLDLTFLHFVEATE